MKITNLTFTYYFKRVIFKLSNKRKLKINLRIITKIIFKKKKPE